MYIGAHLPRYYGMYCGGEGHEAGFAAQGINATGSIWHAAAARGFTLSAHHYQPVGLIHRCYLKLMLQSQVKFKLFSSDDYHFSFRVCHYSLLYTYGDDKTLPPRRL